MEFRWRSPRNLQQFSAEADVVLCAASLASPSLLLGRIASGRHVFAMRATRRTCLQRRRCLTPKSSSEVWDKNHRGNEVHADFHGILNRHPFPDVVHGCLLEGMALAWNTGSSLSLREEYSSLRSGLPRLRQLPHGMGSISHRFTNADGPLEDGLDARWKGREDESIGRKTKTKSNSVARYFGRRENWPAYPIFAPGVNTDR